MVKNKTRRNKTSGGSSCGMKLTGGSSCGMKLEGGKRRKTNSKRKTNKTHKTSNGANTWREGVMRVYKEMKAKNANIKFGDALKEASKRKKAGNL